MFGTFRLILAAAVVAYHVGVMPFGVQSGVSAVVCFYILSGFVMAALLKQHYARPGRATLVFYVDRALRILPQYVGLLSVTTVLVVLLGITNPRISPNDFTPGMLLANVTIIPLNYYMLIDVPRIIPPGWSLGAEVQFYVLAPLLVHARRLRGVALAVGVLTVLLSAIGPLDSDIFGYRVLPGILCFFITGILIYEMQRGSRSARNVVLALIVGAVALTLVQWLGGRTHWLTRDILGGFVLGVAAVSVLARLPRHRFDDALGAAAYGTFLGHWLVIWLTNRFNLVSEGTLPFQAAVLAGALVVGVTSYWLFERPLVKARRAVRAHARITRHSAAHTAPVPTASEVMA